MRIRNRSYATAFAVSAATIASFSSQQVTDALRSSSSPRLLSSPRTKTKIRTTTRITPTRTTTRRRVSHVACRASRTETDQNTNTNSNNETIRIRRKANGAPVIDSVLLQFISQQNNIPDAFREEKVAEGVANILETARIDPGADEFNSDDYEGPPIRAYMNSTDLSSGETKLVRTSDDSKELPPPLTQPEDKKHSLAEENVNYASTTDAIKRKLTDTGGSVAAVDPESSSESQDSIAPKTTSSWMIQFGSSSVAQMLLKEAGVEDSLAAKTAGDAVERYCVVRTARRRIRRFLKERDNLWASTVEDRSSSARAELESLAASDMATSPAASLLLSSAEEHRDKSDNTIRDPSYGFTDVIEVLKDYGLTGDDICVLLTHSPNLALRVPRKSFLREGETDHAETLEETLDRSLTGLLLGRLNLRRYDARKILRTCPGLLSVRGSESAAQVLTIMTKLGVSESSLARDKSSLPVLLSRSPAGLFRLVAFLSSTAVRMPLEKIGPLLRERSGRELMDTLVPVPNTSFSKVRRSDEAAPTNDQLDEEATTSTLFDDAAAWSRTRMERQERIERTYANMVKTASLLRAQTGSNDVSRVISAFPSVLLLDAEKQILPVARYMMGGLGIWKDDLSSVIKLHPTVLGKSIEELEKTVSYVLAQGVEEDALAGIFRAFPGLFALEVETMQTVVDYLKSIGVRDIGSFITKLPPILGYSVEKDLKPKWEFLKTVCLQPEFELAQFPAYFSYPFGRVIKTRFNYLAYKGISIRFVSMRIDTVLRFGDVDFATKVAVDDDGGAAFRRFGKQRESRSANGHARRMASSKKKKNHGRRNDQRKRNFHKNSKNGATSRFEKRYINNNNYNNNNGSRNSNSNDRRRKEQQSRQTESPLEAAKRLSRDIDNAKDLAELNKSFREAMPLRNRRIPPQQQKRNTKQPAQKPNIITKQIQEKNDEADDASWPVTA